MDEVTHRMRRWWRRLQQCRTLQMQGHSLVQGMGVFRLSGVQQPPVATRTIDITPRAEKNQPCTGEPNEVGQDYPSQKKLGSRAAASGGSDGR